MRSKSRLFLVILVMMIVLSDLNMGVFAEEAEINDMNVESDELYEVILPEGYNENSDRSYPVLYLLPDDGQSSFDEEMIDLIKSTIKSDTASDMLIVMPIFDDDEDIRVTIDKVITNVDEKFNTIPTADQRAVLGKEIGGYMAYIMGLTDIEVTETEDGQKEIGQTEILEAPNTVKNMGSIRGNFTGSDNYLYEKYGDVHTIISEIGKDNIGEFYTYVDGPTEDLYSYMSKSTNEIGALFIKWFQTTSYDIHEYTARYGTYDSEYLEESIKRVINRFSKQFNAGMVNGNISLSPQVAASSVKNIDVTYNINVSETFGVVSSDPTDMIIEVTLTDPVNNTELYTEDRTISVDSADTVVGNFSIPNTVNGINSTVSVTAKILGYKVEIGKQSLVRIMDTGSKGDEQLIDLMGDWKFNAYKPYTNNASVELDDINNVTKDLYDTWGTVQPALGWWSGDFDESLNGNPNWTGYAWYVREFEVMSDFTTDHLKLALGKFDEADEVFINGVRVGATGIPEAGGHYDRSNPWDVDRIYELDSSVLKYGQTNTIAIRMINSDGGGGWYDGPVGIFSIAAYNKVAGLPSELAEPSVADKIKTFVQKQNDAIETNNIPEYSKTVASDYFQSGYDKNRLIGKIQTYLSTSGDFSISDENVSVFKHSGMYLYQAERSVKINGDEISSEVVNDYYRIEDGEIMMYGGHERFYVGNYSSTYAASAQDLEGPIDMKYRIYLPDGYFESDDSRYPVVYLLHQFSSTSKSYEIDGIEELMNKGIASGDIQDMIVVIPDSSGLSWWRGDWELMVTEDLIPFINENYRTISDARFNGTAGASMGGQGAYGVGLRNPNLFSSVISFFGAFSYGANESPNLIATQVSDKFLQNYAHYFIVGNRDVYGFGASNIQLDHQLRELGVEHHFMIENGEHDSAFYIPYVIEAFSYVSDRMFSTGGGIADSASGDVDAHVEENILRISSSLKLTETIDKWLNNIPDSIYTKKTNPDMTIPVTFKIVQDGKTVFSHVEYAEISGPTSLNFDKQIILGSLSESEDDLVAYDVDIERDFSVTVFASLLDTNKMLGSFEYTAVKDTPNPKDDEDGEDGLDGEDGADGVDGEDGADGADGKDGTDGEDHKDSVVDEDDNKNVIENIENHKLPSTATGIFNWLSIGIIFLSIGILIAIFTMRKKKSSTLI